MRSIFNFLKEWFFIFMEVLKGWKSNWSNLAILITPILIAIPSINEFFFQSIIGIIIIILFMIFAWFHSNRKIKKHSELKSYLRNVENQRDTVSLTLESVPDIIVKHLFKKVGLTAKDRITIYRYYDDKFINIGRHSDNREFAKKGRKAYPKNKGFIGQCWVGDSVYKKNLPIYENNPGNYINKVSKQSNIDKGVLRKISMKSRCYYCKKLFDTKSIAHAVMVIETTNNSLDGKKEKIDKELEGQFGKLLFESIEINLPIGKGGRNG